jgi:hypothetical protein
MIAEASLSLDYPIMVLIGSKRYTIGSKDEYLYKRLAIQAAVRRKRKAMAVYESKQPQAAPQINHRESDTVREAVCLPQAARIQ